jgi:hypothetical protein
VLGHLKPTLGIIVSTIPLLGQVAQVKITKEKEGKILILTSLFYKIERINANHIFILFLFLFYSFLKIIRAAVLFIPTAKVLIL